MDARYKSVVGACLTQFTVIGLLFSFGLFFKVFEVEFGWSRTLLSLCSSVAFFMMGVLAMLAGPLSDRLGPARVLGVAGLAYGLGFALMSQVNAPWQLFVIFATLIGVGLGTHDVVTLGTVARWFEARRGIMTAVVKVGTALGQIAVPPAVALLLGLLGWQYAVIVMGAAAAILLLVAASLMSRPVAPAGHVLDTPGATRSEARRDRTFWTLCAIQFLFFPSLMAVPLHLAVHGMDMGLSAAVAATLLSVIGAASIAGRLTVGRLVDRIGGKNAFALCFLALMTGLFGLIVTATPGLLYGVTAVYGFAHGGLFVVVSPTVAEYFGMRAHGAIFGTILFFGTIGGAVGPIAAGAVFDSTGSYFWAFTGLFLFAALGLMLVLSLPGRGAPRYVSAST